MMVTKNDIFPDLFCRFVVGGSRPLHFLLWYRKRLIIIPFLDKASAVEAMVLDSVDVSFVSFLRFFFSLPNFFEYVGEVNGLSPGFDYVCFLLISVINISCNVLYAL